MDSLNSVGSIATFVYNSFTTLPTNISGILSQIVDIQRTYVENYTGDSIPSTSILDKYQSAICDFSKAEVLSLSAADPANASISLSDLSIGKEDSSLSAEQYRMMGEMKLKALGRKVLYAKSLS